MYISFSKHLQVVLNSLTQKLTLYGPGYLPLASTTILSLIEDIDWRKSGLTKEGHVKVGSFKGKITMYQHLLTQMT